MASFNKKPKKVFTHEGAPAKRINVEQGLRRSVMACLLWEKEFYEDGEMIASRVADYISQLDADTVAAIASEARHNMNIRHMPLYMASVMAKTPKHRHLLKEVLYDIINRPDELAEFLALYWANGKCPIANQIKKGLAAAFTKFNAYQLGKWDRKKEIKLADVMKLCHPKPKDEEQSKTWKRLLNGTLPTPDTWEVALSRGDDKKEAWTRLLKENKLGAMALLMNLRNMEAVSVNRQLIRDALFNMNVKRLLPYRFITAARMAPHFEPELEHAMLKALATHSKMPGHTVLLVDVSGSMDARLSKRSETTRLDAACGLAVLLREICEEVDIYSFSTKLVQIPNRHGFALRDAIYNSQQHNSTYLGLSVKSIYATRGHVLKCKGYFSGNITMEGQGLNPDRLIAITDEQSHDKVSDPSSKGYMINVASNERGVGYGKWIHVDGWSDSVVRWIQELEVYSQR